MTALRPRAARAAAASLIAAALLVALLPGGGSQAAAPRRPEPPRPTPAAARDSLEQPGTTYRVSLTSREAQANGPSDRPAVSADGQFVVFLSSAANLGAGPKAGPAVVLRDWVAGTTRTVLASRTTVSTVYVPPTTPFSTYLVETANTGATTIYVAAISGLQVGSVVEIGGHDQRTITRLSLQGEFSGAIELDSPISATYKVRTPVVLVSVPTRVQVSSVVGSPTISGDGRWVAFTITRGTAGAQRTQIAIWDATTGQVTAAFSSVLQRRAPVADQPALSFDGRYLAFRTPSGIDERDTNELDDVYVLDRQLAQAELASVATNGRAGLRGDSFSPAISADGNWVAFASSAVNFAPGTEPKVPQVYLRDRAGKTTVLASHRPDGSPGSGSSSDPSVSGDGRVVAFSSRAPDLVAGDGNEAWDVFAWDRDRDAVALVSMSSEGAPGDSTSFEAAVSADGRSVAFASMADTLVPKDTNGDGTSREAPMDVFVRDLVAGRTTRVSVGNGPNQANGSSQQPAISATGRYVAFDSSASNLVRRDTNKQTDVFVRDRVPAIRLAEDPTDFGTVAIGTPGLTRTIMATSTGASAIGISAVGLAGAAAGDFLVATDGCTGRILYPGERCEVQVLFTAAAPGSVTARARFTTDAPSRRAEVTLRATVRKTTLVIEPEIGPPGTVVVATGTGFPVDAPVDLRWSFGITPVPLTPVFTDAQGKFVAQVLVLPRDRTGKRKLVAGVTLPGTEFQPPKAAFLVVTGSGTPPTSGLVQVWADTLGRPILLRR